MRRVPALAVSVLILAALTGGCKKKAAKALTPGGGSGLVQGAPRAGGSADEQKRPRAPGKFPFVQSTFFVKYTSEPNAYLDIAVADGSGSGVAAVVAELSGAGKVYKNLKATFNPKEHEWESEYRVSCSFLPTPIPGGLYWISRVKITAKDGSQSEYVSPAPHKPYTYRFKTAAGATGKARESEAQVGSVYLTEAPREGQDQVLTYFATHPALAEKKFDAVMRIYRPDDLVAFIAIMDEFDRRFFNPSMAIPLTRGQTYLIEVKGFVDGPEHYTMEASAKGFPKKKIRPTPYKDEYEPNNSPAKARPLTLGETQYHVLTPGADTVDWFSFTVP